MRPIRDNRNIYKIWKSHKNRGLSKYPLFVLQTLYYLIGHGRQAWEYINEIEREGCITDLDECRYPGIKIFVPNFRTDLIQKLIVRNHEFFESDELELLKESFLKERAVICDCGAYIGNHTIFFAKVCKANCVYAFEPIADFFKILKINTELNGLGEVVRTYPYALGSSDGRAKVHTHKKNNRGATGIINNHSGSIRVVRLDDIIPDGELIDLIKIDVEGYECELLKGAKEVCTRGNPVIFIEVFPKNRKDVFDILSDYGYILKMNLGKDNYIFVKQSDAI